MREHVLLFCLLGLVLTATIILVAAPGAVTWALALIEWAAAAGSPWRAVAFSAGGDGGSRLLEQIKRSLIRPLGRP